MERRHLPGAAATPAPPGSVLMLTHPHILPSGCADTVGSTPTVPHPAPSEPGAALVLLFRPSAARPWQDWQAQPCPSSGSAFLLQTPPTWAEGFSAFQASLAASLHVCLAHVFVASINICLVSEWMYRSTHQLKNEGSKNEWTSSNWHETQFLKSET